MPYSRDRTPDSSRHSDSIKMANRKKRSMKWNSLSAGDYNAATHRIWKAFGNNAESIAHLINTDPAIAAKIALAATNRPHWQTAEMEMAQEMMGANFFGIEEAIKHFGVDPTMSELEKLATMPFNPELFVLFKDTHILVALFPLSFSNLIARRLTNDQGKRLFAQSCKQCSDEEYFREKSEPCWKLIEKKANYLGMSWHGLDEASDGSFRNDIASISDMAYTIIGHFLNTGERLFEDVMLRCSDATESHESGHPCVGMFDDEGLHLNPCRDDRIDSKLGFALSITNMPTC